MTPSVPEPHAGGAAFIRRAQAPSIAQHAAPEWHSSDLMIRHSVIIVWQLMMAPHLPKGPGAALLLLEDVDQARRPARGRLAGHVPRPSGELVQVIIIKTRLCCGYLEKATTSLKAPTQGLYTTELTNWNIGLYLVPVKVPHGCELRTLAPVELVRGDHGANGGQCGQGEHQGSRGQHGHYWAAHWAGSVLMAHRVIYFPVKRGQEYS